MIGRSGDVSLSLHPPRHPEEDPDNPREASGMVERIPERKTGTTKAMKERGRA